MVRTRNGEDRAERVLKLAALALPVAEAIAKIIQELVNTRW